MHMCHQRGIGFKAWFLCKVFRIAALHLNVYKHVDEIH